MATPIDPDATIRMAEKDFHSELSWQCARLLPAATLICLFAWLPYTRHDAILHPELSALPWLRYGLSAVAALVLALHVVKKRRHAWQHAFVLVSYR